MFKIDDLWRILNYLKDGTTDTRLSELTTTLATSEKETTIQFFENILDQAVFKTDDYKRLRSLFIDWYSSLKTISTTQKNAHDVHLIPDEHLSELFKSFGFNLGLDLVPLTTKANFFLDLVNFYKKKGTPETLVDVLDYYGFSDTDLVEYWLKKDQYGNLVFKSDSVRSAASGSTLLYDVNIPFEALTGPDPHWMQTEEKILELIEQNKVNLPSKSPYFSLTSVFDLFKLNASLAILFRIVQDQYEQYMNEGVFPAQVVYVKNTGTLTSLLEVYLGTAYSFFRIFGGAGLETFTRYGCYMGDITYIDDPRTPIDLDKKIDEFEALISAPISREERDSKILDLISGWSRPIDENFLNHLEDPETLLDLISPDFKAMIDSWFETGDEDYILPYLIGTLEVWMRINIDSKIPSIVITMLGLGFREGIDEIINFFKPYRARLAYMDTAYSIRNPLTESFIADDWVQTNINSYYRDHIRPPSGLCEGDDFHKKFCNEMIDPDEYIAGLIYDWLNIKCHNEWFGWIDGKELKKMVCYIQQTVYPESEYLFDYDEGRTHDELPLFDNFKFDDGYHFDILPEIQKEYREQFFEFVDSLTDIREELEKCISQIKMGDPKHYQGWDVGHSFDTPQSFEKEMIYDSDFFYDFEPGLQTEYFDQVAKHPEGGTCDYIETHITQFVKERLGIRFSGENQRQLPSSCTDPEYPEPTGFFNWDSGGSFDNDPSIDNVDYDRIGFDQGYCFDTHIGSQQELHDEIEDDNTFQWRDHWEIKESWLFNDRFDIEDEIEEIHIHTNSHDTIRPADDNCDSNLPECFDRFKKRKYPDSPAFFEYDDQHTGLKSFDDLPPFADFTFDSCYRMDIEPQQQTELLRLFGRHPGGGICDYVHIQESFVGGSHSITSVGFYGADYDTGHNYDTITDLTVWSKTFISGVSNFNSNVTNSELTVWSKTWISSSINALSVVGKYPVDFDSGNLYDELTDLQVISTWPPPGAIPVWLTGGIHFSTNILTSDLTVGDIEVLEGLSSQNTTVVADISLGIGEPLSSNIESKTDVGIPELLVGKKWALSGTVNFEALVTVNMDLTTWIDLESTISISSIVSDITLDSIFLGTVLFIDGEEVIEDGTARHLTINEIGDVSVSNIMSKYGDESVHFDGSDRLSIDDHVDWDLATPQIGINSWTIDFWMYSSDNSSNQKIIGMDDGTNSWGFSIESSPLQRLVFHINGNQYYVMGDFTHQWHHIAAVVENGFLTLYVDGARLDSDADVLLPNVNSTLGIGSWNDQDTDLFRGYLDQVRIVKGKALWFTTFNTDTDLQYDEENKANLSGQAAAEILVEPLDISITVSMSASIHIVNNVFDNEFISGDSLKGVARTQLDIVNVPLIRQYSISGSSNITTDIHDAVPIIIDNMTTPKSIVIDIANNHGDPDKIGLMGLRFTIGGVEYDLRNPGMTYNAYASTTQAPDLYAPWKVFFNDISELIPDPYLTGSPQVWVSGNGNNTNQRLIIVLTAPFEITGMTLYNYHESGTNTTAGVKDIDIYFSSRTITDNNYGVPVPDSTKVFTGSVREHVGLDIEDPILLSLGVYEGTSNIISNVNGELWGGEVVELMSATCSITSECNAPLDDGNQEVLEASSWITTSTCLPKLTKEDELLTSSISIISECSANIVDLNEILEGSIIATADTFIADMTVQALEQLTGISNIISSTWSELEISSFEALSSTCSITTESDALITKDINEILSSSISISSDCVSDLNIFRVVVLSSISNVTTGSFIVDLTVI